MNLKDIVALCSANPAALSARVEASRSTARGEDNRNRHFIRTYLDRPVPPPNKLFGATFAVKDNFAVRGYPVSFGCHPPLVTSAPESAELVASLVSLGATLIGSTNLDEACTTYSGNNRHYGRALNTLRPDFSTAGSSSGSAAAVARGTVDFALGSDSGGSVRAPAAACGIFGLKSTPGLFPDQGIILLGDEIDSAGFFVKQIEDLRYILESLRSDWPVMDDANLRLVVPNEDDLQGCAGDLMRRFDTVIRGLAERFPVERAELGIDSFGEAHKIICAAAFEKLIARYDYNIRDLNEASRALLVFASRLTSADLQGARREQDKARHLAQSVTQDAFLLYPSLPGEPPRVSSSGTPEDHRQMMHRFMGFANLTGMPALSFPLRLDFSLQVSGPPRSELILTQIASTIRRVMTGL